MLFNSNIKLLIVLLLAVVLICMVNSKGEIPNMGEVEGLEVDDTDMTDEPVDAVEAIETAVAAIPTKVDVGVYSNSSPVL